jgi:hypothetical protein
VLGTPGKYHRRNQKPEYQTVFLRYQKIQYRVDKDVDADVSLLIQYPRASRDGRGGGKAVDAVVVEVDRGSVQGITGEKSEINPLSGDHRERRCPAHKVPESRRHGSKDKQQPEH